MTIDQTPPPAFDDQFLAIHRKVSPAAVGASAEGNQ